MGEPGDWPVRLAAYRQELRLSIPPSPGHTPAGIESSAGPLRNTGQAKQARIPTRLQSALYASPAICGFPSSVAGCATFQRGVHLVS